MPPLPDIEAVRALCAARYGSTRNCGCSYTPPGPLPCRSARLAAEEAATKPPPPPVITQPCTTWSRLRLVTITKGS